MWFTPGNVAPKTLHDDKTKTWALYSPQYILGGSTSHGWLESVEVDMVELEIDRENIHDRENWRKNVMKRNSNPIGKRTINR